MSYKNNYYKLYDYDEVAYKFVRDTLLDVDNIKRHFTLYDVDYYNGDYEIIFNRSYKNCNYIRELFETMISECGFEYNYIMYRIITPAAVSYAREMDMEKDAIDWIIANDDTNIVSLYAISSIEEIMDTHQDFIKDILNGTTAKKIAINKLKRNKIVIEGLLLKISIKYRAKKRAEHFKRLRYESDHQKMTCECGWTGLRLNRAKHPTSKRHINWLKSKK